MRESRLKRIRANAPNANSIEMVRFVMLKLARWMWWWSPFYFTVQKCWVREYESDLTAVRIEIWKFKFRNANSWPIRLISSLRLIGINSFLAKKKRTDNPNLEFSFSNFLLIRKLGTPTIALYQRIVCFQLFGLNFLIVHIRRILYILPTVAAHISINRSHPFVHQLRALCCVTQLVSHLSSGLPKKLVVSWVAFL